MSATPAVSLGAVSLFVPDPADHDPVPEHRLERMREHFELDQQLFMGHVGIQIVEIRLGYCRITMPFDRRVTQAAGAVHGGAVATMIDMAAVPAIASHYDESNGFPTIDLHIQYMGDAAGSDLTAVGWTTKTGRSIAFARAVVMRADGRPVATGQHTFKVG